jgi:hypothetical protein
MTLSFHRSRHLGIGILSGVTLLVATVTIMQLLEVVGTLQEELQLHERKVQLFDDVALRFSQLGTAFYQQRVRGRLDIESLKTQLDSLRQVLTELDSFPLMLPEKKGVTELSVQENRFRTAMYAFAAAVREDPAPGFSGTVLPEIDEVIHKAPQQAFLYKNAIIMTTQQTRAALVHIVQRAIGILAGGTLVVLLLGLGVNWLLAHTFSRAVTMRTWNAIYKFGTGNSAANAPSAATTAPPPDSSDPTAAPEHRTPPPTPNPSTA